MSGQDAIQRRALAYEALGNREGARADLARIIAIGTARGLDPAQARDEYRKKFVEYEMLKRQPPPSAGACSF